jgi:hypothetical protein
LAIDHGGLHGGFGLGPIGGDGYALAGGQTVGFDDNRKRERRPGHGGQRRIEILADDNRAVGML